ncbi:RNA 3'-terminal phosphate cyclase [Cardiobacteriaceae bacterium TAE3-ERU3]|nr:RNA 3'-terminal phosphate cyclase [Cardiobacteriaceae bacterium TAE3-ERU3]
MHKLILDGRHGEGGGQILRTALALSVITGTPFTLNHIRAGRAKPGLMRQHLACVRAAQTISDADVIGGELDSQTLHFHPHALRGGDYVFDIGSAGSTTLVLQTILPALLCAEDASSVNIKGGTHNPFAPTADFLIDAFAPAIADMGLHVDLDCSQAGFYPLGGGTLTAHIKPRSATKIPFDRRERGNLRNVRICVGALNLERKIAERIIKSASKHLNHIEATYDIVHFKGIGQGIVASATVESEHHREAFTVLGDPKVRAENVGKRLAGQVKRYLQQNACVDEYLTDQLLLPLALTGGGQFSSRFISEHTRTQINTISQFLPCHISHDEDEHGAHTLIVKP